MNLKNNIKYIGIVKWYHDHVRDANYGFIQHDKLGEVYFNERSIEQDIKLFSENTIVVFKANESKKHKGKFEASVVKYLEYESDLNFLFSHYLSILSRKDKYSEYKLIQIGVHLRISLLLEKTDDAKIIEELFKYFQYFINEQIQSNLNDDETYIKGVLKFAKDFFPENYKEITNIIEKNISIELAHKLWLDSYFETCQVNYLVDVILMDDDSIKQKILNRCSENDIKQLFECFKKKFFLLIHTDIKISELQNILKVGKQFFSANYNQILEIIEENISVELAHKLWLNNHLENCQIDYIAIIILAEPYNIQKTIFNRCTVEDKNKIFFKVLNNILTLIDSENKLNSIIQLLNLSKIFANELFENLLEEIIKNSNDFYKLILWLKDFYNVLDFQTYKHYTAELEPIDQKRFVKKVLKYIHEEKVNILIEDLTSLNVLDFKTSKIAEKNHNIKLDYSTSIILNVISELKAQTNLETRKDIASAQHRIYDLIIKQIKEPIDIIQITGFFDECEGRCNVSVHEGNITYKRNEYNKAKNHPICDGRKAIDRITKEPILSEENVEYWWCANQKCFSPSRRLHSSKEWERYSLLDFLTILNVDFKESDFEIYLNIINKANRFLKHLNCRECKHILYPKGKTKYAFYGVNRFICKTETCFQKGKEIYLSHCLNGLCEMEIDSRDCVKCKPSGFKPECGWYVCNYCHSCCSSAQLELRKWSIENNQQEEYRCHLQGHRDLGIISCNKCGEAMKKNDLNILEYNKVLKWFITNKDTSEHILKSGTNKKGKWWFTIGRGRDSMEKFKQNLIKFQKLGFQIPDIENDKNIQLISEPIDLKKHTNDILSCSYCDNILDLTNDAEKSRAVKKFHYVSFAKDVPK